MRENLLVDEAPYVFVRVVPVSHRYELMCMPYQIDIECRYVEFHRRDRKEVQESGE